MTSSRRFRSDGACSTAVAIHPCVAKSVVAMPRSSPSPCPALTPSGSSHRAHTAAAKFSRRRNATRSRPWQVGHWSINIRPWAGQTQRSAKSQLARQWPSRPAARSASKQARQTGAGGLGAVKPQFTNQASGRRGWRSAKAMRRNRAGSMAQARAQRSIWRELGAISSIGVGHAVAGSSGKARQAARVGASRA